MMQQPSSHNGEVFILLAPGFEEGSAIYCLDRLREAGILVSLVGLSAGLISGAHGVTVRPDRTLGQTSTLTPPYMVLVPDGKKSVTALLADPRVHRLLTATIENNGNIAAMPAAAAMLENGGIGLKIPPLIPFTGSLDEFASQLINSIMS